MVFFRVSISRMFDLSMGWASDSLSLRTPTTSCSGVIFYLSELENVKILSWNILMEIRKKESGDRIIQRIHIEAP